ncbi:hypothetical protein PISMIDRAFT_202701 [Pisolithus microcarpus 441]|uniref:Uncharacterized protein n=1 Tax=Pisolithus microcarpus 441 TaxID=765257 RepID=A0A0C9ZYD3_9AGAM|nr:hypothetical protein PISMIDRAFT_202701 [Pisolithus microcarpus 441]
MHACAITSPQMSSLTDPESVINEYVELTVRPALINLIINTGMGRGWYFCGFRQSLTSLAPSLARRLQRTTNCLNFSPVCQSTRLSDEPPGESFSTGSHFSIHR